MKTRVSAALAIVAALFFAVTGVAAATNLFTPPIWVSGFMNGDCVDCMIANTGAGNLHSRAIVYDSSGTVLSDSGAVLLTGGDAYDWAHCPAIDRMIHCKFVGSGSRRASIGIYNGTSSDFAALPAK
jgi:hypothetical protein